MCASGPCWEFPKNFRDCSVVFAVSRQENVAPVRRESYWRSVSRWAIAFLEACVRSDESHSRAARVAAEWPWRSCGHFEAGYSSSFFIPKTKIKEEWQPRADFVTSICVQVTWKPVPNLSIWQILGTWPTLVPPYKISSHCYYFCFSHGRYSARDRDLAESRRLHFLDLAKRFLMALNAATQKYQWSFAPLHTNFAAGELDAEAFAVGISFLTILPLHLILAT